MLIRLEPERHRNSHLARSAASAVAPVKERTFICSKTRADADPTNDWEDPTVMGGTLSALFRGPAECTTLHARALLRYAAQHDSCLTSLVKVCAQSFSPSTIVRYGKSWLERSAAVMR